MNILHKITIFIFIYFSSTNAFPNFFPNVSSIPPSFLPNTTAGAWGGFNKLSGCRPGQNVTGISKLKNYFHYFGYITNTTGNFTDDFDDDLESAVKNYQRNFNLNATGELDESTVQQILKPRYTDVWVRYTMSTVVSRRHSSIVYLALGVIMG
ncbi:hypothetical protein R6Q59_018323 [Mikania micrantha]|uniref:Peptidoglycan binding-like domain-containing protein n=1 Tax=Mikania micrantha TaxID=192012 RepID=A0A5N6M1M3_9ASTR|nr:hypothetical protein E3N88_35501 [Mikania micrantha]